MHFTDKVRAYWTGSPHDLFDPVSCHDYANYIKGSVQKWTAAKVDLRSNRPGGAQLNRRMTIEDLDKQVQGFTNMREASAPTSRSQFIATGSSTFSTLFDWREGWRRFVPGGWRTPCRGTARMRGRNSRRNRRCRS
jgi:hypothetical protein